MLWSDVWTEASWLGHFPSLLDKAARFRVFVKEVFTYHPIDPSSMKTRYAGSLAEWEASPYAWYRLAVLGVVSICLQNCQFWPELNVILERIRAQPDFDKVVAGAAAESLVSSTPHGGVDRNHVGCGGDCTWGERAALTPAPPVSS